jgi:GNAT superfamily N-acetyltransferase
MPPAEIREARIEEVEALLGCYEWLFAPPGSQPASWEPARASEALAVAIGDSGSTVFVAESDGALVGICTAYLEFNSVRYGRRCWVEDLAVDPARRSEGIGKDLLDAAKAWARARGATHLELDSGEARKEAHRFYERERPAQRALSFSWEL